MNIIPGKLEGTFILEPQVFGDARGFFMEIWNADRFAQRDLNFNFVQDNISRSSKGVLRGLHFQNPHAQGKLVTVLEGSVYDVAVDIRAKSPTFGAWEAYELSAENRRQFYVPAGFAHGFVVTSESALFMYKCTEIYHSECESSILWNDPRIGIEWPIENPKVSAKDQQGLPLAQIPPQKFEF
jgi:dTDP-4-dehydrorhamnose 3,5-epimerase